MAKKKKLKKVYRGVLIIDHPDLRRVFRKRGEFALLWYVNSLLEDVQTYIRYEEEMASLRLETAGLTWAEVEADPVLLARARHIAMNASDIEERINDETPSMKGPVRNNDIARAAEELRDHHLHRCADLHAEMLIPDDL